MNSIEKIHFLVKHLNEYTKLYDEGNPVISDSEWDDMYFELVNLIVVYSPCFGKREKMPRMQLEPNQ